MMIDPTPSPKDPIDTLDGGQGRRVAGVCLVLAAITFAVFGQTLHHQFVDFDDNDYVYANPMVAQGLTWKGIVWAFSFHAANWHPLTWLSHMLDFQLYGLHPGGHHLTNVLIHIATVIALFLVLRQMTGALWRSAFVAALFAIHPLRVESVAWVAERKDVLSGLFFMLTVGAYVHYARRPRTLSRYGLVVLLFALGLMCKPMLVTLPVVLLLLDYWPLQRAEKFSALALEKLPLLALSAASCGATLVAQHEGIQTVGPFSAPVRLANALVSCVVYAGQMIWPSGLAAFYPYPLHGLPAWNVALAGLLLAGFSAVAFWQRRNRAWMLAGWLWYLVMLLPALGIIQVGRQAHADRYTYLPQIGLYLAVTWLAAELAAKWRVGNRTLGILMGAIVTMLAVCAWKQTAYWQNSETVWIHAIESTTDNGVAHSNLGTALAEQGKLEAALEQFQIAVQINPGYADFHNNFGNALFQVGKAYDAAAQYQIALQEGQNDAVVHNNLGNALEQEGKTDEAVAQYQIALQINPRYAEAEYDLGNAFALHEKPDQAIIHYEKALQINPGYGEAHDNLGITLMNKGNVTGAMAQYQMALQTRPADPGILNNLAWLLAAGPEASLRDGNKAVELASRANALTGGGNPIILHTLAAAFAEAGRFSEALGTAQRALQLAEAQSNSVLAGKLKDQMKLFQAGRPFHSPEQTRP
jgi:tetratricopeptide (TPR) repeat protein